MLAFNNQTLEKLPKGHPFLLDYKEKCELLVAKREKYDLRFTIDKVHPRNPFDPDSKEESAPGVGLPARVRYAWSGGSGEVQYYNSFTMDKGEPMFIPNRIDFTGFMLLDVKKELDLIFFLIFVSPFIEIIPEWEEHQNLFRRRSHYRLYDHEAVVDSEVKIEELVSQVSTFIYNKDFGIPIQKLRIIASAFSIPGVSFMKDNEVKISLAAKILAKDSKNKYNLELINDFLSNMDTNEMVFINSLIQTAIDHDLIRNRVPGKTNPKGSWYYNSEQKELICEIGTTAPPRRSLLDFLISAPEERKEFERVIQQQTEVILSEKENQKSPGKGK